MQCGRIESEMEIHYDIRLQLDEHSLHYVISSLSFCGTSYMGLDYLHLHGVRTYHSYYNTLSLCGSVLKHVSTAEN